MVGRAGSDAERPPAEALRARASLLGGYLRGPLMLVLCGPQGAGKTWLCRLLTRDQTSGDGKPATADAAGWVHVCQDALGARERCEGLARDALRRGECVVIDRMHLSVDQRESFVAIGKEEGAAVHAISLTPPTDEVQRRVRERTGHKIMGAAGAAVAGKSAERFVPPTHAEGFALTSVANDPHAVDCLAGLYRAVPCGAAAASAAAPAAASAAAPAAAPAADSWKSGAWWLEPDEPDEADPPPSAEPSAPTPAEPSAPTPVALPSSFPLRGSSVPLPAVALGTMSLTGGKLAEAVGSGFAAVDTAPTYKNEAQLGELLERAHRQPSPPQSAQPYLICKVPHTATTGPAVRAAVRSSLSALRRSSCELLLLHWPKCIGEGTLREVWCAMEACVADGEAGALGVCNFSPAALRTLLPMCVHPPLVNQVERHPLLPQWELVEYCSSIGVLLQAHTPLGHGKQALLGHPTVARIAGESGLSPAQLVLQWNLRHGVAVVPKCSTRAHAAECLDPGSPSLTAEQMQALDDIATSGTGGHQRFVSPGWMTSAEAVQAGYGWARSDGAGWGHF